MDYYQIRTFIIDYTYTTGNKLKDGKYHVTFKFVHYTCQLAREIMTIVSLQGVQIAKKEKKLHFSKKQSSTTTFK